MKSGLSKVKGLLTIGVVVVVIVAIAGYFIVDNIQERESVDNADAAAKSYNAELADYEASSAKQFSKEANEAAKSGNFGQLMAVIKGAAGHLPTLKTTGISGHGKENSAAYAQALESSESVTKAYDELADYVAYEATVTAAFVNAGLKPLLTDTESLGIPDRLSNGDPVREKAAKPYTKMLKEFQATTVPDGQDGLAKATVDVLHKMLDEIEKLASRLDEGRGYHFNMADEFKPVIARFEDLRSANRQHVVDKVNAAIQSGQPD